MQRLQHHSLLLITTVVNKNFSKIKEHTNDPARSFHKHRLTLPGKLLQDEADTTAAALSTIYDPDGLREQDINGCLPMHDFCHYGICLEGDKLLQEAYPEGIQIVNNLGNLPIHYDSLQNAPLELLDFLLLSYPESMEKKSPYGNPSMLMKKKHRNWLQTKDEHGKLPLHHAFEGDLSKNLRRLIRDAHPNGIHDKDIHGKAPLDYKRKSWKFWNTNTVHKKNAEQLEFFTTIPHEDPVTVTQAMQPRIVDEWSHHNTYIAELKLLVSALERKAAKMKEVYRRRCISMLALLLCILFCFLFFLRPCQKIS